MYTKIQTAGTDECCPGNCNQCPEVKGILKNLIIREFDYLEITAACNIPNSSHKLWPFVPDIARR